MSDFSERERCTKNQWELVTLIGTTTFSTFWTFPSYLFRIRLSLTELSVLHISKKNVFKQKLRVVDAFRSWKYVLITSSLSQRGGQSLWREDACKCSVDLVKFRDLKSSSTWGFRESIWFGFGRSGSLFMGKTWVVDVESSFGLFVVSIKDCCARASLRLLNNRLPRTYWRLCFCVAKWG